MLALGHFSLKIFLKVYILVKLFFFIFIFLELTVLGKRLINVLPLR